VAWRLCQLAITIFLAGCVAKGTPSYPEQPSLTQLWVAPYAVHCTVERRSHCLLTASDDQFTESLELIETIRGYRNPNNQLQHLSLTITDSGERALADVLQQVASLSPDSKWFAPDRRWLLSQLSGIPREHILGLAQAPWLQPLNRKVIGFDGCNQFERGLFLRQDWLQIDSVSPAHSVCQHRTAKEVQSAFAEHLSSVNRWQVSWPKLWLFDHQQLLVELVAEDWD